MRAPWRAALAAGFALSIVACGGDSVDDAAEPAAGLAVDPVPGPTLVRIQDPGLHPEGVEWDAGGQRFLVSSVTRGTVTEVRDDGSHSIFINDPDIVSSIGIHIDRANGRLLVANSNLAVFQGGESHAMLGSYDLETGERIFMVDLGALTPGGPQFANDVTTLPDGTALVTNYQTPAIYTVSLDGEAAVLAGQEALAPGGINGIDVNNDGVVVAARQGTRGLVRVGMDGSVTPVTVPEPMSVDGLVFMPDGRLVAVAGTGEGDSAMSEVLLLSSADGWSTATIEGRWTAPLNATTAAVRDGQVYVIDARFADMGGEAPHFDISKVEFE